MPEETADSPKKRGGWPKGKPRKRPVGAHAQEPPPTDAPIHVRLRLKDYGGDIEFGCARRLVENGFHVFFYPSKRDPYRETRREFAISEIIDIEITEARQVYDYRQLPAVVPPTFFPTGTVTGTLEGPATTTQAVPVVHSAKEWAMRKMAEKLEQSGSAKVDAIPGISFGESVG